MRELVRKRMPELRTSRSSARGTARPSRGSAGTTEAPRRDRVGRPGRWLAPARRTSCRACRRTRSARDHAHDAAGGGVIIGRGERAIPWSMASRGPRGAPVRRRSGPGCRAQPFRSPHSGGGTGRPVLTVRYLEQPYGRGSRGAGMCWMIKEGEGSELAAIRGAEDNRSATLGESP